jgi:uncharacterized damage-inducible protein DinB
MSTSDTENHPRLEAPGKGLPFIEWFVARYFIIPKILRSGSIEKSLIKLNDEAQAIQKVALSVDPKDACKRILVPRLQGLEDSSRYWSIAMTLEHLRIVITAIRLTILKVERGESIEPISTADVKPKDVEDINATVEKFMRATQEFIEKSGTLSDATKQLKFPHPWFGQLTVEEWIIFAPLHHKIHHRQILEIKKRL